jgi:hypothetical protein
MPLSFPAVMNTRFEAALRAQCLSALDDIPTPEETQPSAAALTNLLRRGTQLLELFVVVTATAEAVDELGIRTFGDVRRCAGEIQGRVASVTGIDVPAALRLGRELGLPDSEVPADDDPVSVRISRLVRFVGAVTASCPTYFFDHLASVLTQPELGYRFGVACEALRSFLRRHDPHQRDIVLEVGRLYQRGVIELKEASKLLAESPTDTIAILEEQGFGRTVAKIRLTTDERRRGLAQIREDRIHRSGAPSYSREIVRRSTIASERIEGVDARPWLIAEPEDDRRR